MRVAKSQDRSGRAAQVGARMAVIGAEPYMSERQLKHFRVVLTEILERTEAANRMHVEESHAEQLSDTSDVASQSEHNLLMSQQNGLRQGTIVRVLKALKRLDEGEFGYCLDTGDEIGLERLYAYPYAERTVEAQTRADVHAGRFGRAR